MSGKSSETESANSPEARVSKALVQAAKSHVDLSRVIEQMPKRDRLKVLGVLSGFAEREAQVLSSPEVKLARHIDSLRLEEGFEQAMEAHKVFQLLKMGEKTPDFGQVRKVFTQKRFAETEFFQNPKLILRNKGRSFVDLVSAVDGSSQLKAMAMSLFGRNDETKSEGWSAFIVEGEWGTPTGDGDTDYFFGPSFNLEESLQDFRLRKKLDGIKGMDRWKWIQLLMLSLSQGRTTFVGRGACVWTILDEDPAMSKNRIPFAGWDAELKRVVVFRGHPGHRADRGRFRKSVGGDVPDR